MTPNAKTAFDRLVSMGVSVMPWGHEDGYCRDTQFVLIWASDDGSEVFACLDGQRLRERWEGDRLINCMNIREDIHVVLSEHGLWTEWANSGQLAIKDGPDATGYRHGNCAERFLQFEARVKAKKAAKTPKS